MRPDSIEWLRLCLVPGIPGTAQRGLLKAFGTPAAVLSADLGAVAAVAGPAVSMALASAPDPELLAETLVWLEKPGCHLLTLGDEDYPREILHTTDPPTVLYAIGDVSRLNHPSLAIVGSRNASHQGKSDANRFAQALSDAGYCIVSGLALGIDSAAHHGGLTGNSSTIAVVGTGLDRVYPAVNQALAREIGSRGALVSEFALGTPPAASNFPRRNRIISGLSQGVLVVEAALKSGSLTTARLALEQGRDVFAIPGSIHSPMSRGCHWLIKQGAKLVESADDVIGELRGQPPAPHEPATPSEELGCVLQALGHAPASPDALSIRTGMPMAELAAELTRLEIEGHVERLPGGLYRQLAVP